MDGGAGAGAGAGAGESPSVLRHRGGVSGSGGQGPVGHDPFAQSPSRRDSSTDGGSVHETDSMYGEIRCLFLALAVPDAPGSSMLVVEFDTLWLWLAQNAPLAARWGPFLAEYKARGGKGLPRPGRAMFRHQVNMPSIGSAEELAELLDAVGVDLANPVTPPSATRVSSVIRLTMLRIIMWLFLPIPLLVTAVRVGVTCCQRPERKVSSAENPKTPLLLDAALTETPRPAVSLAGGEGSVNGDAKHSSHHQHGAAAAGSYQAPRVVEGPTVARGAMPGPFGASPDNGHGGPFGAAAGVAPFGASPVNGGAADPFTASPAAAAAPFGSSPVNGGAADPFTAALEVTPFGASPVNGGGADPFTAAPEVTPFGASPDDDDGADPFTASPAPAPTPFGATADTTGAEVAPFGASPGAQSGGFSAQSDAVAASPAQPPLLRQASSDDSEGGGVGFAARGASPTQLVLGFGIGATLHQHAGLPAVQEGSQETLTSTALSGAPFDGSGVAMSAVTANSSETVHSTVHAPPQQPTAAAVAAATAAAPPPKPSRHPPAARAPSQQWADGVATLKGGMGAFGTMTAAAGRTIAAIPRAVIRRGVADLDSDQQDSDNNSVHGVQQVKTGAGIRSVVAWKPSGQRVTKRVPWDRTEAAALAKLFDLEGGLRDLLARQLLEVRTPGAYWCGRVDRRTARERCRHFAPYLPWYLLLVLCCAVAGPKKFLTGQANAELYVATVSFCGAICMHSAYRASTAYQAVKLFRRLRVVLFQLVGVGGYEAFYWYYSMRERYRGHTPGGKCTNISFFVLPAIASILHGFIPLIVDTITAGSFDAAFSASGHLGIADRVGSAIVSAAFAWMVLRRILSGLRCCIKVMPLLQSITYMTRGAAKITSVYPAARPTHFARHKDVRVFDFLTPQDTHTWMALRRALLVRARTLEKHFTMAQWQVCLSVICMAAASFIIWLAGSLFLFDFHWSSVNVLMLFDTGVCMTLVLSAMLGLAAVNHEQDKHRRELVARRSTLAAGAAVRAWDRVGGYAGGKERTSAHTDALQESLELMKQHAEQMEARDSPWRMFGIAVTFGQVWSGAVFCAGLVWFAFAKLFLPH